MCLFTMQKKYQNMDNCSESTVIHTSSVCVNPGSESTMQF